MILTFQIYNFHNFSSLSSVLLPLLFHFFHFTLSNLDYTAPDIILHFSGNTKKQTPLGPMIFNQEPRKERPWYWYSTKKHELAIHFSFYNQYHPSWEVMAPDFNPGNFLWCGVVWCGVEKSNKIKPSCCFWPQCHAEAETGDSPLCLSSASGDGSRPRNSTNTWMQQSFYVTVHHIRL